MSEEQKQASSPQEEEVIEIQNYIDGRFEAPEDTFENPNPATAQLLARVPRSSSAEVDRAVAAAKRAFPAWNRRAPAERAAWLYRIADALEARLERLAELESRDTGKPLALARAVDIPRAVENFRFFAGAILHEPAGAAETSGVSGTGTSLLQSRAAAALDVGEEDGSGEVDEDDMRPLEPEGVVAVNYTQRSGVGVAGLITPWNLPLYLLSWKVAPALACGNTIVCKPSEITPVTALYLSKILDEINFPKGVFNMVHGYGATAGSALVGHPDVGLISFTGGTVTGRRVAEVAAPQFKKLSLELGGKNATVVFADCDFQSTVQAVARASFANQGQICLCGSRLFVEEPIYDRFMTALVEEVQKLRPGDPRSANFGSLSSLAHRDKIEHYVELARKDGARVLCGGARPSDLPAPFDQGAFYLPTILGDLPPGHACSQEEIFGPVLVAHSFRSERWLMQQVNSVRYGLAGSLWTRDIERAHRITRAWDTGMVWVNTWLLRDLRVPFGGVKDSGVGREGGRYSLEFYSQDKNICFKF